MKRKMLVLLLLASFFISCDEEVPLMVEDEQSLTAEVLGTRTLSWISPYLGFSEVVFENEKGESETFTISVSEISKGGTVFSPVIAQTKDVVFTSTTNAERSFIISPTGNSAFYFYVLPLQDPFNPELFLLYYSTRPNNTFMVQLIHKGSDIKEFDYTYSPNYPVGIDEELAVIFNAGSNKLFKSINLKQREGLIKFEDLDHVQWTLKEIK